VPASRYRIYLTLLLLTAIGLVSGSATWSAFSDSTDNSSNSFAAGTVAIDDNDAGADLLSLVDAKRGDLQTGCINVSYSGSLNATVSLSASTTGGLADYLDITVTRGSAVGTFPLCVGFTPDGTDYIGQGNGVIYKGPLSGFPQSGAPLVDPTPGSPATWSNGDNHVYQVAVGLPSSAAGGGQGLSSTLTLAWEAQNQ
jgi:predicted ribosomally synthesized peptide with SipW-like signal peptide